MQKNYVLLRQDKQTGPYSLQELVQFDLKPYDLIWIEGESAGWYYPQEIAALHPYLRFLPKKPAAVSPVQPAAKKPVEPLPTVNDTEAVPPVFGTIASGPTTAYQPLPPVSDHLEAAVYAQFRQSQREDAPVAATPAPQKKRAPGAALVGAITVMIVGGVFAASWLMNRQSNNGETATESITETPPPAEITPAAGSDGESKKAQAYAPPRQKSSTNRVLLTPAKTTARPSVSATKGENNTGDPAGEATVNPNTGKTGPEESTVPSETPSATEEAKNAPQEKKKTLKDKFLDLFRKKPEEKQTGEGRSAETENGERTATRRESNLLQLVHVRFDVPNDWMMGIKGAKATLVNRSSEKITSATVEVLYYNDDNELLQKKVVTFGKIEAKDAKTMAIPDHHTATKVDYRILSVNGAGQPAA